MFQIIIMQSCLNEFIFSMLYCGEVLTQKHIQDLNINPTEINSTEGKFSSNSVVTSTHPFD